MPASTDRQLRVEAIERRLGGAQGAVEDGLPEAPGGREAAAVPARGARGRGRFPGAGRTLSGEGDDEGAEARGDSGDGEDSNEDGYEDEGEGEGEDNADSEGASDFGDEFQDDDDDDDDDDDAEADYSSGGEGRASRGGRGTYNLRAPGSKRKHAVDAAASESDGGGPALRRRTRAAVSYVETAVSDADSGSEA